MPFWTHQELLNHEFGIPHLIVSPIIPWGGICMLHGPYESGKSLLALTLAVSVARGEPWLTEYKCRQGTVGLVQVDMPDKLYQERQRLARIVTEDLPLFHFTTDASHIDILKTNKRWTPELEKLAEQKPALVIVDSLRKSHRLDENDSNSASAVYGAWRNMFPHATLLFLHHDRKTPTGLVSARALEEQFRGNTAWIADLDTGIHLVRQRAGSTTEWRTKMTFSKLRTCEEQPPLVLRMDEETLLLAVADPTPRQRLLGYLKRNMDVSRQEAVGFIAGLTENGKPVCSRATAYRLVSEVMGPDPKKDRMLQSHNTETEISRETG